WLFQGKPGQPGRRPLRDRRQPACGRLPDLLLIHQRQRHHRSTGRRHTRRKVGWHWGFGVAGVGMVIGLIIYLAGRKYLPPDSPIVEKHERAAKTPLTRREKMAILALLVLLPVLTLAIIGNQQIFNAYLVWAEKTARLPVYNGETMPITWLITLDAALSVS